MNIPPFRWWWTVFVLVPSIALYTIVLGTLSLISGLIDGRGIWAHKCAQMWARLILVTSGVKIRLLGRPLPPTGQSCIFVANHSSIYDVPILFTALRAVHPRLRILYKAELRKLPVLVRAWDLAGFVPLERGNPEQSLPAIDGAAQALREGASFLIFPEGTRSRTGALLPFKKGGFIMALKGEAPIVPTAISGTRNALRKGSFIIRPVRVRVRVARPVETAGLHQDQRDQLIAGVRDAIERMLTAE